MIKFGEVDEIYEWCSVCKAETRHYYSGKYRSWICSECRSLSSAI